MNRTGSIGSLRAAGGHEDVQPGQSPGRQHLLDRRQHDLDEAQPTGADVAAGQATLSGGTTWTPRRAQRGDVLLHGGWRHISVCMAGQTTTGASVASSVAVSRSFEMPAA